MPHFQQELESSCVAAGVRRVLAHYGDLRTEAERRSLLGRQPTGTRAGNVLRRSGAAFAVYLRPSTLAELQQVLTAGQPPILFLATGALEYWSMDIVPRVVAIGLESTTAVLDDPCFATAPQSAAVPTLEQAWAPTGQVAAFVRPRKKP